MSDDIESLPAARPDEPVAVEAGRTMQPGHAARPAAAALWLVAFAALALAAFALWRVMTFERAQPAAANAVRDELGARIDALSQNLEQRKRDFDGVRARLTDADNVDKSVREELLALGERSRHLEDAVANLAEQRQSGRDALAMNEAEFLLQQGQERLALFHDAAAAATAYRLADSALAAAPDPVFASVRQTISAELRSLDASKPLETGALLAALERIRSELPTLPLPRAKEESAATAPSRWQAFFGQFVHVSHDDALGATAERDIGLSRSLMTLDLRDAEAALLAADPAIFTAAVKRARLAVAGAFDANAESVKTVLAELDRLTVQAFPKIAPELGGALKELRNLRATRALSQPAAPAAPPSVPPAPAPAPPVAKPALAPDAAETPR